LLYPAELRGLNAKVYQGVAGQTGQPRAEASEQHWQGVMVRAGVAITVLT